MNVLRRPTNTLEHPNAHSEADTRLHGRWLLAARLSLFTITVLNSRHLHRWHTRLLRPTLPIKSYLF